MVKKDVKTPLISIIMISLAWFLITFIVTLLVVIVANPPQSNANFILLETWKYFLTVIPASILCLTALLLAILYKIEN